MKKISIAILALITILVACKKTPEVNLKYVDVERELITVGVNTATVQCNYQYITTLKKAFFYYGEGINETDMNLAEMRVVQNTLYVDLSDLKGNTTYSYYYEFVNGFNSMRSETKTFKTEASPIVPPEITLPTVVTAMVTEITTNSVMGGGEVTDDGGGEVTERGICWGTNANPSLSDNHIAVGSGLGAYTALMDGLEANATYHVCAYATNEVGTAYGLDREFTTLSGGGGSGDHEYVDLGLPSGTLWATCNVGANAPEECGDYFAWGETSPKDCYDWSTYQHCFGGSVNLLTKYVSPYLSGGYNGLIDYLFVLLPEDDAATVNWGNDWRMPTYEEWQELIDNTTSVWTTQNGVSGRLFTASNANSVFLPVSGDVQGSVVNEGGSGSYWSSSLVFNYHGQAWSLGSAWDICCLNIQPRCHGRTIRPVHSSSGGGCGTGDVPTGAINGIFTVNYSGDHVCFSQGNLQYQASTNTWRFAMNQWDCVGDGNLNISPSYNGWIDMFGWGTSGFNHGSNCFQPWSTSQTNSDYYAYGNYTCNLYDRSGQADWGYNPISNGGNTSNQWRTLKQGEWWYIFNYRSTTSGIRYAKAEVNYVNGVILLPDDWSSDTFNLNNTNNSNASFSSNMITASQWSTLEDAGAVFLPATMSIGEYWSASISQDFFVGYSWPYVLYFVDAAINWPSSVPYHRNFVRLVCDVNR